jgi:pimeloyl-ACP methyl ester carboxylesterase
MARIVLVHGAFNELWGPHEIASRWVPAVRDGLWHHGIQIDEADVAVCFYGDLFRRSPGDVDESFEASRAGVADMLTKLGGESALAAISQAANEAVFERTVDLITTIATRADLREQVRARVEHLMTDDVRVVVAHSLGSIVAYHALATHPQWSVDLVTLGSPLGVPMVLGQLDPPAIDGKGQWPGAVQRWTNVAAVGDKAAAQPRLAEVFGEPVEDHLIDNGHRAHDPEPYLNASATGAAIARALEPA